MSSLGTSFADAVTLNPSRGRPLVVGLFGASALFAAISVAGGLANPDRFAFSYLTAFCFVVSVLVGALFWVMIHHLTDAGWSVVIRRVLELLARSLTGMILLFIPIALLMNRIFDWTSATGMDRESAELLAQKTFYLNVPFFLARTFFYFLIWGLIAETLARLSMRQDRTGDRSLTKRMQAISAPSMIALAFTTTFASFDWLMSLDFKWYSTIFGVYFWAGSFVGALSALILILLGLRRFGWLAEAVTNEHLADLGKLLIGFVIFWSYIAFSQYFLIWYGNLPEETEYYIVRRAGDWNAVSIALAVGHFLLPFLILLPYASKRNPRILGFVALWVLVFHYLDLYWQTIPNLSPETPAPHWLDFTTLIAVSTATLGISAFLALGKPLVPLADPRLQESLSHHA